MEVLYFGQQLEKMGGKVSNFLRATRFKSLLSGTPVFHLYTIVYHGQTWAPIVSKIWTDRLRTSYEGDRRIIQYS